MRKLKPVPVTPGEGRETVRVLEMIVKKLAYHKPYLREKK
jgi:hypothetical protein